MSLGAEDFIVPEEPRDQEHLKHQLIATARSLKKKQQQLQADQDLLNDRWTEVLDTKKSGLGSPTKSYPKHRSLPQGDDKVFELVRSSHNVAGRPQLGSFKAATQAELQTAPSRRKGKKKTAHGLYIQPSMGLG